MKLIFFSHTKKVHIQISRSFEKPTFEVMMPLTHFTYIEPSLPKLSQMFLALLYCINLPFLTLGPGTGMKSTPWHDEHYCIQKEYAFSDGKMKIFYLMFYMSIIMLSRASKCLVYA